MTEDEFFKRAQTFHMSEAAQGRVLGTLRTVDIKPSNNRNHRQRRWVSSALAGVAAILIVVGATLAITHSEVKSPTTTTVAKHSTKIQTMHPNITTRGDGAVLYTYTGTDFKPAVRRYGNLPVKVPMFPVGTTLSDEQFMMYPAAKNRDYPEQSALFQRVEFDASIGNEETFVVQEWTDTPPAQNPFDTLVGPGDQPSLGKPQTIKTDGVNVRVGWPLSNETHVYQFIQNGTFYFVKVTWDNNNAPVAAHDTDGWRIVRSLITGKAI